MAFRDLVMGTAGCGEPSSSNNPLAGLANSLLGTLPKAQERIRELPSLPTFDGPGQSSSESHASPLVSLPGSESHKFLPPEFIREYHQKVEGMVSEFERFGETFRHQPEVPPPDQLVSGRLRSFIDSSKAEVPFHDVQQLGVNLSDSDKQRIRDRSSIMARHFMLDKGEDYVNTQVSALLHSLDIEDGARMRDPLSEMERHWTEATIPLAKEFGMQHPTSWIDSFHTENGAQGWASEFNSENKARWATEFMQEQGQMPASNGSFHAENGAQGWASEFHSENKARWATEFMQEQEQIPARNGPFVLEGSDALVQTLSSNKDPKFQNSKFLNFVSKMSRGELIVEDNQVKENLAANWANEYSEQEDLAAEFTAGEHAHRGGTWVDEFSRGNRNWVDDFTQEMKDSRDIWAKEYISERNPQSWAEEFQDSYANYSKEEREQPSSSKWVYQFSEQNPYVGHANPLKEGQELFRRGLLSEAVLALEAEVLKNPANAEGWRLLGITQAENDDDLQAIASMFRAREVDPTNLEVQLSLGVSHTNELDNSEALRYLRAWLQYHPTYGTIDSVRNNILQSSVTSLYNEVARLAPEDGDVHTVLGVLYNLSREYDKAIEAFQTALKLKPMDYSLWNKLGATQANSARSADAIFAYQRALKLKPNYVRAWTNMGISYANQARYEESIRYFVRALSMNPKAENAWQYLRMSLL